ncbi:MAG: hypothetical protein M0Z30_03435 [Actinomycetota bacterium]|nr:hypothetical protein [Actinomycetota bacterium]
MQLTIPPTELIDPVVESAGFTFVEEDDVAFSLRLCREVNRIYGEYQEGLLASTDAVQAGLAVTVEMLAVLSRSVRDGMPSMRITVAAAQTREMLVVVFGRDPMQQPLELGHRERYRDLVADTARRSLASGLPLGHEEVSAQVVRRSRRRWFGLRRG